MESNNYLLLAVSVIGAIALAGFFLTKTSGFGRFSTSAFLLLLVVIISGLCYAAGKIQADHLSNILLAVIGFAGGLVAGNEQHTEPDKRKPDSKVLKKGAGE